MRCVICDYSPDTPSDFHRGLSLGRNPKKLNEHHGEMYCDVCDESFYEDDYDLLIDPVEEEDEVE